MTNQEETQYIHQLLDLMKDRSSGYFVADDGMRTLGFGQRDYPVLMRRLEEENLATVNYATNMILTSHGLTIARGAGGYNGYKAGQQRQQAQKSGQEARSALGSILGGAAGVVGAIIAGFALWDSHQTSGELESLRKQMQQLTQTQGATQAQLASLAARQAAAQVMPYQNQASTPKIPAMKRSPAPIPVHKPAR